MSANSKFDTPNISASEAIVLLHSEVKIDAPAAVVFRALRNTDTWKDWNRFVPKANITYQPPEDSNATAVEIQELIRNTSLIGSFDSDLTDGGSGGRRPKSPDEQPPPRFRLNSISSQMSSDEKAPRLSESLNGPNMALKRESVASTNSGTNGVKSGAQRFQEAQESRKSSIANGEEPEPIANTLRSNTDSHRASVSIAPPTSPKTASSGGKKKPKYTQSVYANQKSAERALATMMSVYGEYSVRLMIGTKLTFFCRMKPNSPSDYSEVQLVVTDVARPDDPLTETETTALTRSKTHQLDRSGGYRVVWTGDSEGASIFHVGDIFKGSKMPKYLLHVERVHTIEPTGEETCIYKTWELQKGHAAKAVKKKYNDYLQKMFGVWTSGMKEFCEGLHAPKIDRRDFSISADEAPIVIQTLT